MSFAKYYLDELTFLREMGREFAEARPEAARFLGEAGADPDVERLLEGFAFLTGRIRQKLDDELPEITQGLMEMFLPHYLRPVPSFSIVQFRPRKGVATEAVTIERGTEIEGNPIDGTRCRFRTAAALRPAPVRLVEVVRRPDAPRRLTLRLAVQKGRSLTELADVPLRLHLVGEQVLTRALYLHLRRHLSTVSVGLAGGSASLARAGFEPVGFEVDDTMLPAPAHAPAGFRVLQEYFAFPQRFMFVDLYLRGLDVQALEGVEELDVVLEFGSGVDELPPIPEGTFRLDCGPVVNLFAHDADPIRVQRERSEYAVRPGGNPEHYEVYSIDTVRGIVRGSAADREYRPFFAFEGAGGGGAETRNVYQVRAERSVAFQGTQHVIRFAGSGDALENVETVSVELHCTNRQLPAKLGVGDICRPAPNTPLSLDFANISPPTPAVPPPTDGEDLHWKLLAHLAVNLSSIATVESLRTTIGLYDFRARVDRQARRSLENRLAGIVSIATERTTRLHGGCPVRGLRVDLVLDEDLFGGEGEMLLFGSVLDRVLSWYVSMNSFCELRVRGKQRGEVFEFPARLGEGVTL